MQELLGSVTKASLPATRGISKEAVQHGVIVVSYTCLIVGTGSQAEVQNPPVDIQCSCRGRTPGRQSIDRMSHHRILARRYSGGEH